MLRLRTIAVRLGFALGSLRPLRYRVVLATSHSSAIGGNLAWIRDALGARQPTVPVVVLAFRHRGTIRGRLAALVHAIRSGYQLATARAFVVDDYFFALYVIRPRAGTRRIQVWHAAGAFKKFGYSVLDKSFGADEALLERVPIHSNYDLCLVSSSAAIPHYAEAFGVPVSTFTAGIGIPRTDLFFDEPRRAAAISRIHQRYAIPEHRRVVLYAPTFRGDSVTAARDPGILDLGALHARLGADHVVLLRLHPFVRQRSPLPAELATFAMDVSDHPDINELMLISDVLVTDYSSAIFEFALLGRPMAFLAPDLDAYERERGFYFDFRTGVPGPVFETTEALADWLRAGTSDTDRVRAFARASFDVADGHATERLVEQVLLPALDGRWTEASARGRDRPEPSVGDGAE